jgi:hypothetical protein
VATRKPLGDLLASIDQALSIEALDEVYAQAEDFVAGDDLSSSCGLSQPQGGVDHRRNCPIVTDPRRGQQPVGRAAMPRFSRRVSTSAAHLGTVMHAGDETMPRPPASVRGKGGQSRESPCGRRILSVCMGISWRSHCTISDARTSAATRCEILAWLRAPQERSGAFSYRTCCTLFGLDPDEIRERVLARHRHCFPD